jgi:hypothetical protein
MNKTLVFILLMSLSLTTLFAQTKVSGIIVDKMNQPVSYANVVLRVEPRVMSNEDGRFYLESKKTLQAIIVTWAFQIERIV